MSKFSYELRAIRRVFDRLQSVSTLVAIAIAGFVGCLMTSTLLNTPIPRVHDEFSYLLNAETLASRHVSSPAPPLPEFFDTFHVLVHPIYASKYFPAQGVFLAIGQKLTGYQPVGLWLSSALACAAITWMLLVWLSPGWAALGGFLIVIQYGVFSYWSQSYWGGMVPALGGALVFGAIRRLWDSHSWRNSLWLGLGLVILATSRPLEGLIAVVPVGLVFLHHLSRGRGWVQRGFWIELTLPSALVLSAGALALGAYNHAITGSAFLTPYELHERQYQENSPFIFMPLRPKLTYSSPMLQFYYEINEMKPYLTQRVPKWFVTGTARKLATWWEFYCGFVLSIPLVLPGLLKKGKIRLIQAGVLAGFVVLSIISSPIAVLVRGMIDLLVIVQVWILWRVFDDWWSRLAIATCAILQFELLFTKWEFPHYFAPAACLIWYEDIDGLRNIWNWNAQTVEPERSLTRAERRRLVRENESSRKSAFNLRWVVYAIPVACLLSLIWHVEGRLNGWPEDDYVTFGALPMDDWSLDRANLAKWLEQQPSHQLVFVRYWQNHNVMVEWVYNHPDIMHSHVIWARDLGAEHNKLLLNLVPDRTVWLIEADRPHPQLIPYSEVVNREGLRVR
jgi:hypothetical protein